MSKCKWCQKKGYLLKLTDNGICEECNPVITKNIVESVEQFQTGVKELRNYIFPTDGLKQINIIKNSLSVILKYESVGIPTIEPLASELFKEKMYGRKNSSIQALEKKLLKDNDDFEKGLLKLEEFRLWWNLETEMLSGIFAYDSSSDEYVKNYESTQTNLADWMYFTKIGFHFSNNHKSGIYKEYYKSGKLRRIVPFIQGKDSLSDCFLEDGVETIYYEDKNSQGEDTYTILEENSYKEGDRCDIWKKYSIDGGLMEETNYDTIFTPKDSTFYGVDRKEFYPQSHKLKIEEHKNWGKEYYDSGNLRAEWENKNYFKNGKYVGYYEDGRVSMKVNYIDNERDGLMYKYFEDGNVKELWNYNKGKRKFVKKYFENGNLKTEWLYDKDGIEISKKYYDKKGSLIRKV